MKLQFSFKLIFKFKLNMEMKFTFEIKIIHKNRLTHMDHHRYLITILVKPFLLYLINSLNDYKNLTDDTVPLTTTNDITFW